MSILSRLSAKRPAAALAERPAAAACRALVRVEDSACQSQAWLKQNFLHRWRVEGLSARSSSARGLAPEVLRTSLAEVAKGEAMGGFMASLLGNSFVTAQHFFFDQEAAATALTGKQQERLEPLQAAFPKACLFDLSQRRTSRMRTGVCITV